MPLPGGAANKFGNRYEKWWTLSEFVRILFGSAEAIRLEEPDVDKAEFVVTTGSRREFHQAKRSNSDGKWSLARLRSDGLLQTIGEALADNVDRFVFASGSDAPELSDLSEAANAAESVEEFERVFLKADARSEPFEKLCRDWACDVPTAFDRLRRIEVRTIGEPELREKVEWGLQALFIADPTEVQETLSAIAEDSIHKTITPHGLSDVLAARGYPVRPVRNPEQAAAAVRAATDREYLDSAQEKLIRQELVERQAAKTLLSRLGESSTDSVVTGKAGSGKTACVVQIVKGLRERGMPVLALRLDRLASRLTTIGVGQRLGLEESPARVLAAATRFADRPGVLLIDQLDAVSTMSGRMSGAFDLVEGLLREARGVRAHVPIHIVVVCREFDWRHDSQLRHLVPDSEAKVEVTEFTPAETSTILSDAGFDPTSFRSPQLELLRLPQNLSLFLEAGFDVAHTPAFDTAKDLFDRYWDEKRQKVELRATPSADRWLEVVEGLCTAMTSAQQLSVPKERLDGVSATYLEQMASEGVITFDGRRYGFGHESFFDYCFARMFSARPEALTSFIETSEQHLFRRAQVRQVLTYLRDADPARYLRELRGLLANKGIRAHIKHLTFALLAEVRGPTDGEWAIWKEWIAPALKAVEAGTPNPSKLSELARRRFFGSAPWFNFADGRGLIEKWLASGNDGLTDMAVNYLRVHQRHSPDRAAALLEPYADRTGQWVPRLRSFMERVRHHTSRRLFDLFLRLVNNGTVDEARGLASNGTFWSMLYGLDEQRPDWVPEVLAHRLRRRLHTSRQTDDNSRPRELLGYDNTASRMFRQSATSAPSEFVEHVLPAVLEVSDSTLIGATPPKRDAVWVFLHDPGSSNADHACLEGLAKALSALAGDDAAELTELLTDFRRRHTYTANYLLLALYAGAPTRYADEAVSVLCEESWRLQCGRSNNPHWYATEAIRVAFPHCGSAARERLEQVLLSYVDPFERTSRGYKRAGWSRFTLLSAIPPELRSRHASKHFQELARKFGVPEGEPKGISGGFVEPPIAEDAIARMTDQNWLQAIAKYSSEERLPFDPNDPLKGGAVELAGALAGRVKEEPERFARLSLQFPPDANPTYLARTLAGLEKASIENNLKLQVCRKAFAESPVYCGQSIADVLGNLDAPVSDDAVRMLHWLATEHEDPSSEAWQQTTADGRPVFNREILTSGINSARGRAACAIAELISKDASCIAAFRPTLDRMIQDRSAAVISCALGTLRAVAYHDPALGLRLFQRTNLSEDRLLATHHARSFIRGALRGRFSEVRPVVERMLRSSEPEVCEVGACMASLAALQHEIAVELADEALSGSTPQRLGAAQVAAANIAAPEHRAWCEQSLARLFEDEDAAVRAEAASCFRALENEALDAYTDLIETFCNSRAYQDDSFWMLHTLEKSRRRLPGTTCMACERFFDRFAEDAQNPGTGRVGDTGTVVKLIFRTYQQHQDDEWTSRSLDLIDRLCLEGIYEVGSELDHFDR